MVTKPVLTTTQVAKIIGVAPRTVCLWAESLQIPGHKLGRQWRFDEAEIEGWLKSSGFASAFAARSVQRHGGE